MMTLLNKILSLTWVGDLAEKLDGNKTLVSVVGFVLSGVILLLPEYFPELSGAADVARRIQELLLGLGVDLHVVSGLSVVGAVWGASHKVVKKLDQ